jgi:hypothetical protein
MRISANALLFNKSRDEPSGDSSFLDHIEEVDENERKRLQALKI